MFTNSAESIDFIRKLYHYYQKAVSLNVLVCDKPNYI